MAGEGKSMAVESGEAKPVESSAVFVAKGPAEQTGWPWRASDFGTLALRDQAIFHWVLGVVELSMLIWSGVDAGGDMFIFLTIWTYFSHVVYFLFSAVVSTLLLNHFSARAGSDASVVSRTPSEWDTGALKQVPDYLQKLVFHRARFSSFNVSASIFVAVAYWILLFPVDGPERFSARPDRGFRSTMQHGVILIAVIEALLVRHTPLKSVWYDFTTSAVYCVAYLVFNMIYFGSTGLWVYPFVQEPLGSNVGIGIVGYAVLIGFFASLVFANRALVTAWWRMVDNKDSGLFCRCCQDCSPGPCAYTTEPISSLVPSLADSSHDIEAGRPAPSDAK